MPVFNMDFSGVGTKVLWLLLKKRGKQHLKYETFKKAVNKLQFSRMKL